jgi:hypothetical protein
MKAIKKLREARTAKRFPDVQTGIVALARGPDCLKWRHFMCLARHLRVSCERGAGAV